MREIKFRAWDNKRQLYAQQIQGNWRNPRYGRLNMYRGAITFVHWLLKRYTIEQHTGLKDKNGKEIYEGDIIKINPSEESLEEYFTNIGTPLLVRGTYLEVFGHGAFFIETRGMMISYLASQYKPQEREVIGNIHENPELLENRK